MSEEIYYKFKGKYVFNNKGQLCYLSNDKSTIYAETLERGDGVITTLKIDLFNGDINEVSVSFESTYIKDMKIKRRIDIVNDENIVEITEVVARNILEKNGLSVSDLLNIPF